MWSRRAALVVVTLSAGVFLAFAPLAAMQLEPAAWFIPLFQSVLIINDLITAAMLFGQLRLSRARSALVLASGYVFAAVMGFLVMLAAVVFGMRAARNRLPVWAGRTVLAIGALIAVFAAFITHGVTVAAPLFAQSPDVPSVSASAACASSR